MKALRSLFRRGSDAVAGLDISNSGVKWVELTQAKSGIFALSRCAVQPLPQGCLKEGSMDKMDDVIDSLQQLLRRNPTKTKNVVMALPSATVITKKVNIPDGLSESELDAQIESEARQFIPFAIDEVSLDFHVLGPNLKVEGEVEVLIAASRKDRIEERLQVAEACGLTPVIMDIDSYAARRAALRQIPFPKPDEPVPLVALFDVGSEHSALQILQGDEVLYERDITMGGNHLTQMIERKYSIDFKEAEHRKRRHELPDDFSQAVLFPFVDQLAQEVGRALQFFFSSSTFSRLSHIYVSGGSGGLTGLTQMISRQAACNCTILNPFASMQLLPTVSAKLATKESLLYLTATGLAMRRFLT